MWKSKIIWPFMLVCVTLVYFLAQHPQLAPFHKTPFERKDIVDILAPFVQQNTYPKQITVSQKDEKMDLQLEYTLSQSMQDYSEKLFAQYKPDYGAMVLLDAKTGRILAMQSFNREQKNLGNLALQAQFPSASIFKVITATAVLDRNIMSADSRIAFNGSSHSLYKKNVFETKKNRWTRFMSIREAFAKSVNSVFAKLGVQYLKTGELDQYARRFKFNEQIPADIPVQLGVTSIEGDDQWEMAETASGFTRNSRMSPLQGALIAASVVNDGVMMAPSLIEKIHKNSDAEVFYELTPVETSVTMKPETAKEIRELMRETVRNGTSRKSFRDLTHKKSFYDVEFGGKTGSLMSLEPRGKCDWFVGYANGRDHRIAIGIITVHKEKWTVKSSFLARQMFEKYYKL